MKMQNDLRELAEQQDGVLYIEQVEEWIESVVEQLEEEKSDWNDDYNVPITKAIEIVKGGVDNG
jgi:hypothetical protein